MVRFTLRLPDNVYNAVVMRATANRRSVNRQIVTELTQVGTRKMPPVVVVEVAEGDEPPTMEEIEAAIERVMGAGW